MAVFAFPLRCIGVDEPNGTATFVYETTGENAVSYSPIRLQLRDDGYVLQDTDAWLDQVGVGETTGSGVGVIANRIKHDRGSG